MAAVLFVAVFVLRLAAGDVADVVTMLCTLLVGADISALGWVARVVPLLLLGYLLGEAADRIRQVEAARRALERAAQRHRDAVEINHTIVQGMAAAKWSLEAGNVDGGLRTLDETMTVARQLVSDLLRDADMVPTGSRTADRRFSRLSDRVLARNREDAQRR